MSSRGLELNLVSSSVAVSLQILTADDTNCPRTTANGRHRYSKLVINSSALNSIKPNFHIINDVHKSSASHTTPPSLVVHPNYHCFLKSCFLCCNNLRLDKDVYMYRGDRGFCSEACRERQIYLDEIREIEKSRAQRLASSIPAVG